MGIQKTKMAAALAGLSQGQNQGKQQSGSASDRSLRSVFGMLRFGVHIFIEILNKNVILDCLIIHHDG